MLPDWDVRKIIPNPIVTFVERLKLSDPLDGKEPDMKPVYNIHKQFTVRFNGNKYQDWSTHIDLLETTFFESHNFVSKQCVHSWTGHLIII